LTDDIPSVINPIRKFLTILIIHFLTLLFSIHQNNNVN